jgi:hypothetical protein
MRTLDNLSKARIDTTCEQIYDKASAQENKKVFFEQRSEGLSNQGGNTLENIMNKEKNLKKKEKNRDYFHNESGMNFIKAFNNKENEFEIENLRRNLDMSKSINESQFNYYKRDTGVEGYPNYNIKMRDKVINDNIQRIPSIYQSHFNLEQKNSLLQSKGDSKPKVMNLLKLRDFCSKRKMIN